MIRSRFPLALLIAFVAAACAATPAKPAGPVIQIPTFAADDARVGTAGFVGETLRLHRDDDGVRYTLMAFRVGDTWTLGAMVKGNFAGEVHLRIGDHTLRVPFATATPAGEVPVVVEPAVPESLVAQGASFRGIAWTNVELGKSWLAKGSQVQLQFVAANGKTVTLPDAGMCYTVDEVAR